MTSVSMLFKVVKDPQPGRPEAISVVRDGRKIPCPTLEDYLQQVVSVFYDAGGEYADALQTLAKLSMARNWPRVKPASKKHGIPQASSFSMPPAQSVLKYEKAEVKRVAKRA